MNCNEDNHKRVLVTGFGPFNTNGVDIKVNASGEAVKRMNKEELESRLNITLLIAEIPVQYKFIDEIVPSIWNEFQPHLTIHVGVSDITNGFTLEKMARKAEYILEDSTATCPVDAENPCWGPHALATDLEMEIICKEFNYDLPKDCYKADISHDAGNYLCEYIYYTSLSQQLDRFKSSLFVHVPLSTTQQQFQKLAQGLERLLEICVGYIRMQDTNNYQLSQNYGIKFNGL